MSKKLMEQVTKALKDAGVELKAEVKDALSETLGSDALKAAGLVELGSGDVVVKESKYNELSEDLRKEKVKRRDTETERDTLRTTLDAGDSDNKKRADRLEERNRALEPLNDKLMKRARTTWKQASEKIPAEAKADAKDDEKKRVSTIRGKFVFPEKDKELDDTQVLANLDKYEELSELGVFGEQKASEPPGRTTGTTPPRTNPASANGEPLDRDAAWGQFLSGSAAGNAR